MSFLRPGIRRFFRLATWRTQDATRDVQDEMALHIALRAEQLEREGHDPEAARAEARKLFAQRDATLHELYDVALDRNRHMRLRERWESIWQDTRYAARRLAREPAVTGFILVTLALGIGANVTAFSIVDRVLLRGPQHVREPERLIRLYARVEQEPLGMQTLPWLPFTAFTTLRDHMQTIDGMGAFQKLVRADAVMDHQALKRRAVVVIIAILQCPGLVGIELQKLRHIGRHVTVDLRKQIDVMRIERVVEIEDPFAHMVEIGGFGQVFRLCVHGLLYARFEGRRKSKRRRLIRKSGLAGASGA